MIPEIIGTAKEKQSTAKTDFESRGTVLKIGLRAGI
jgi:hypothetical protein